MRQTDKRRISRSTVLLAGIYLFAAFCFALILAFGVTMSSYLVSSISLVAIVYLLWSATLYEVRYDENNIYLESIYKPLIVMPRSAFASVKKSNFILGTVCIAFADEEQFDFAPLLKMSFNLNTIDDFVDEFNKTLAVKGCN